MKRDIASIREALAAGPMRSVKCRGQLALVAVLLGSTDPGITCNTCKRKIRWTHGIADGIRITNLRCWQVKGNRS